MICIIQSLIFEDLRGFRNINDCFDDCLASLKGLLGLLVFCLTRINLTTNQDH